LQPGIALLGKSALSLSYEDLSNSEAIPSTTALGEMRERVHFDANIECQQQTPVIGHDNELTKFRNSASEGKVNLIWLGTAQLVKLRQMVTSQSKKSESCLPISVRRDVHEVSYFPVGGGSGLSC
jgi:hypothetical protein